MTGVLLATLDLPRPGIAEDAPPLALVRGATALIGVFDGLGGAGSRHVEGEDGRRSSAYYAARLARAAAADAFASGRIDARNAAGRLACAIGAALAERHAAAPVPAGRVRSALLRRYPTTAALLLINARAGGVETLTIWAGDSRCYALTPAAGLQQLSVDDTAGSGEAAGPASGDGRMTHLLSADAPAQLRSAGRRLAGPALLLAATDGSHDCLPSPIHLELILLDALETATSPADWAAAVAGKLRPVADDDISLSAAFTGWASLAEAASGFVRRRASLRAMLNPVAGAPDRASADALLAAAWRRYRPGYMALAGAGA